MRRAADRRARHQSLRRRLRRFLLQAHRGLGRSRRDVRRRQSFYRLGLSLLEFLGSFGRLHMFPISNLMTKEPA